MSAKGAYAQNTDVSLGDVPRVDAQPTQEPQSESKVIDSSDSDQLERRVKLLFVPCHISRKMQHFICNEVVASIRSLEKRYQTTIEMIMTMLTEVVSLCKSEIAGASLIKVLESIHKFYEKQYGVHFEAKCQQEPKNPLELITAVAEWIIADEGAIVVQQAELQAMIKISSEETKRFLQEFDVLNQIVQNLSEQASPFGLIEMKRLGKNPLDDTLAAVEAFSKWKLEWEQVLDAAMIELRKTLSTMEKV